jgi:hypothetical protein
MKKITIFTIRLSQSLGDLFSYIYLMYISRQVNFTFQREHNHLHVQYDLQKRSNIQIYNNACIQTHLQIFLTKESININSDNNGYFIQILKLIVS